MRTGPTVLIVGGIHGNEPAGALAAEQIRHWPLARGRLVVLPRANVQALWVRKRYTPNMPRAERDLNRNFPTKSDATARGELAQAIWQLVERTQPDWLVDLQEGSDFHQINEKSVGSSVIVHAHPETDEAAAKLLAAVNATIPDEKKHFVRLVTKTKSTLAFATGALRGARSLILETTTKKQHQALRARQHRVMVLALLRHLDMVGKQLTVERLIPSEVTKGPRLALYDGGGVAGRGLPALTHLAQRAGLTFTRIGPEDIEGGALAQFDVTVFSGGSGSAQASSLRKAGREAVRAFVEQGGGYVGICAGAYLATSRFTWGLRILDAKTAPKWRRGKSMLRIELTDRGREILGADLFRNGLAYVLYQNGPVYSPGEVADLPDYEPLAFFRTEVAENETPPGAMTGTPAIAAGRCGKGRVLCFSPHPEQTPGLEDLVLRAVRWVTED